MVVQMYELLIWVNGYVAVWLITQMYELLDSVYGYTDV